jgi:predicted ATPase
MQRIKLNNFRVFGKLTEFDLAPTTVLTGKNNSGKSSLIKAFLVLTDYLESKDQTTLRLDGPNAAKHRITSFNSLRNRQSSEQDKTSRDNITLGYTNGDFEFEYEFDNHVDSSRARLFKFTMRALLIKDELVLQRISRTRGVFELSVSQNFIDFLTADVKERDRILNDGYYERELAQAKKDLQFLSNGAERILDEDGEMPFVSGQWLLSPRIIEERQQLQKRIRELQRMVGTAKTNAGIFFRTEVSLHAEGLTSFAITDLLQEALASYIREDANRRVPLFKFQDSNSERKLLLDFRQRVAELMAFTSYHLGPNRTHQARLFIPQQGSSEIGAVARAFVQARISPKSTASKFLQNWLRNFELGEAVAVESVEDTGYTVAVKRTKQGEPVSLADLGFGAGQLLAILLYLASIIQERETQAALRGTTQPAPAIVLIEEPEANLHPFLQSLLAKLFLETANNYQLPIVIETHSEYLIRKIQLLVAERAYSTDDVLIHYLDPTGNRRISVLPDGKMSEEFGPGFIDEADEIAMQLFRNQKKAARTQSTSSQQL